MILWLLIPVLLLFTLGLVGSFFLTRRFYLKEIHTPAEYGLEFEEISFPTPDGLTLRGWLVPGSAPERVVVILHGHGGSIDYDVQYIPYLHAAGYSVLQFDFRAHGRSQGNATTFGYLEGPYFFGKSRNVSSCCSHIPGIKASELNIRNPEKIRRNATKFPLSTNIRTRTNDQPHAFILDNPEKLTNIAILRCEIKDTLLLFMIVPENIS